MSFRRLASSVWEDQVRRVFSSVRQAGNVLWFGPSPAGCPIPSNSACAPELFVINDVLAETKDLWWFFRSLREQIRDDSLGIVFHAQYLWQPLIRFWTQFRRHDRNRAKNWISEGDIRNLLHLNGFEFVSREDRILFPFPIPGLNFLFNRILVKLPGLRRLAMMKVYFIRPRPRWRTQPDGEYRPSVSIIIPARDEKGNIERCVKEVPELGSRTEVIFVEGFSTDGTGEEIQKQISEYHGKIGFRLLKQGDAKGKGEAVRLGFDAARGDILMILDSDLSVLPQELPKFYSALIEGHGDLIMGSRLVYPLEDEAMRTLNIMGNKVFSLLFSWLLDQPIKDTLCGTKVFRKRHYDLIKQSRSRFGSFDPFGDFELIFGAALNKLKIVEIPIRYACRTYGETKISRFAHGWLLLRMCWHAFKHFKLA